ncbi:MAG: hypothetical protein IT310_15350, partial [Anaerolineales bacterium]|nr:hypothetical protein [Anaerolineales bacterium]
MNYQDVEKTAEYNRQRIAEEMTLIHFERKQRRARAPRPGLFTRAMFSLASWMITTGKGLRKKYELPSPTPCKPASS